MKEIIRQVFAMIAITVGTAIIVVVFLLWLARLL